MSRVGYLMGRPTSAGAVTAHGVSVTGIGEATASGVLYRSIVEDLSGSVNYTDMRNALDLECADIGDGTVRQYCRNAAGATGTWGGEVFFDGLAASRGVDVARHPETGAPDRAVAVYHNPTTNRMVFRTRSHVNSGTWSAEAALSTITAVPQAAAVTVTDAGILITCYVGGSTNRIFCDRRADTSWLFGPDVASGITGGTNAAVSLAHFNGYTYLTYARGPTPAPIYWRRLMDGSLTWSAEQSTGLVTQQAIAGSPYEFSAALASGDEDHHVADSNELWLTYVEGGGSLASGYLYRIGVAQFNEATLSWGLPSYVSTTINETSGFPGTSYYRTRQPLSAAFFRGRLHIVARGVTLVSTSPPSTSSSVWSYMSCAPPCDTPATWSRVVEQDGTAQAEATLLNGDTNIYLMLLRRQTGSSSFWRRSRMTD